MMPDQIPKPQTRSGTADDAFAAAETPPETATDKTAAVAGDPESLSGTDGDTAAAGGRSASVASAAGADASAGEDASAENGGSTAKAAAAAPEISMITSHSHGAEPSSVAAAEVCPFTRRIKVQLCVPPALLETIQ